MTTVKARSDKPTAKSPAVSDIPTYSTSEGEDEEEQEEEDNTSEELPREESLELRLDRVQRKLRQAIDEGDEDDIYESLDLLYEFPPLRAEYLMVHAAERRQT